MKAASPLSLDGSEGNAAIAPRSGTFKVTLVTVQLSGKSVADTDAINMGAARNSITSAHNYWNSASAGRLSMATVSERRHVSSAKITDSYGTIMATVTRELGWQYRPYESLVLFVPHADLNYNGSWGILGGGFTDSATSGRVIMPYPSALTNNVVTHEFGHVLGLHHANSLTCSNGRSDVARAGASWADAACYSAEYSDTTDLMGYAQVSSPRINAFLWEYGGFGLGNEIRDIGTPSSPGQYTLKAWAGAGADRAIKFTDPVSKEVYYLELRLPVGDDTVSARNGNRGVKITKKDILGWSGNASIVLTPNSRNSGWNNTSLAWQVGQTFTTHAGTKVRIESIGTSDARVTIEPLQSGAALAGSAIAAVAARTSELGASTSGIVCGLIEGGCYQNFQGGAVTWTAGVGAHATINGAIRNVWQSSGFETGPLGYPTSAKTCGLRDGGCYQNFQRGAILWSSTTGAHMSPNGAIRNTYAANGFENGGLGYPTGPQICGITANGCYQDFQGGAIHWTSTTGAHATGGDIRRAWAGSSYETGRLGYPTSGETCGLVNGGCYQNFQGGAILWSSTTGARTSPNGAIRNAYAANGFERSGLGYPTSNETCGLVNGGCYQNFQGGAILWTSTTGARITGGEIRNAYAASGFETGGLGYPTSNETCGLVNGGCYQNFQGGAILWSPTTGARVTGGQIRAAYAASGFETGRLGYPTSNETCTTATNCKQTFQRGTITWTPTTGARISYS
ncbi:hypothetical protein ACX80N_12710 [Arthrobacter sp. MDT2-16]